MHERVVEGGEDVSNSKDVLPLRHLRPQLDILLLLLLALASRHLCMCGYTVQPLLEDTPELTLYTL